MTSDKGTQDDWRIDRRTALKAAGLASVGVFGGTTVFSGVAGAQPIVGSITTIAYIPLSGTAEVAIVDVDQGEEELELVVSTNPGGFDADDLLTNRLEVDEEGVAWALNTTAGTSDDIQAHLVRIVPEFDDDDNVIDAEVTIWDIGAPGDRPRGITFDDEGHLWVAFYSGEYLLEIDPEDLNAGEDDTGHAEVGSVTIPRGDPFGDDVGNDVPAPYIAEFEPFTDDEPPLERKIWMVSRDSRVSKDDVDRTVFTYDLDADEFEVHRTDLHAPYFIAFDSEHQVWVSDARTDQGWPDDHDPLVALFHNRDEWLTEGVDPAGETAQLRGLSVDQDDHVFVGSTDGKVVELEEDPDGEISVEELHEVGDEIVGVGLDAINRKWFIDLGAGLMNVLGNGVEIDFGPETLPYAYKFAVLEPQTGDLEGYKALTQELYDHFDDDIEVENPLADWEIQLLEDDCETEIASTLTDEDGLFEFTDLEPGDYCVCEVPKPGTVQIDPPEDGCHVVEVEAGETTMVQVDDPEDDVVTEEEDGNYAFLNDLAEMQGCTPGFWCNPAQKFGWWSDNAVGGYHTTDTLGEVFGEDGWLKYEEGRGRFAETVDLADKTLAEAVCDLSGGPDLSDAQNQLAGHATAALLNAAHEFISYPMTVDEVIEAVQTALATNDRDEILAQKDDFDYYNNLGCTLNAHGEVEEEEEE